MNQFLPSPITGSFEGSVSTVTQKVPRITDQGIDVTEWHQAGGNSL